MWTAVSRTGAKLGSITGLLALLAGVPVGQVLLVGWPLPQQMPDVGEIGNALTSQDWLTDTNLVNTLSVLLWVLWAMFATSVVVELVAAVRGVTAPRYRFLAPAQGLAAMLVAGLTTAILTSTPAATATTPLAGPVTQMALAPAAIPGDTGAHTAPIRLVLAWNGVSTADRVPEALAAGSDGASAVGPVYEVVRGDWLWHIAARYLGDPLRYVEIEKLNPNLELRDHRFPDHIEATWRIQLPVDAHDRGARPHANGTLVATAPTQTPTGPDASSGATPAPSTGSTVTPDPSTPGPAQSAPVPAQTTPTVAPSTVTTPPATAMPGPAATTAPVQDRNGVTDPAPAPTIAVPAQTTPVVVPTAPTAGTAMPAPVDSVSPGQDPDGVIEPVPTRNPEGTAGSPSAGAAPNTTGAPPTGTQEPTPTVSADGQHGVSLPNRSGWVPWALAGALAAAAAMVWLQRRRNYNPRPLDGTDADDRPEPVELPPTMRAVRRAWRQRPDDAPALPAEPTPRAKRPASAPTPPPVVVPPAPAMPPLPRGGLGLTGPAAADAARGALVSALASGAPTDPDAQSIVVIPTDDMITLLGTDAITIGTWPRLRVTPDLDSALKILEARLLGAARLLDEHDATDLAALRAPDSTAPPLPPMLLVTAAPPPPQQERLRMVLGLGQSLDVTAVLLGDWKHGQTVTVDPDGTCRTTGGGEAPGRLAVLDIAAAEEVLRTLREAHTGEAVQPAPRDPAPVHDDKKGPSVAGQIASDAVDGRAHVPAQADHAVESRTSTEDSPRSTPDGAARAWVCVLGAPRIANRPEHVRLRAYAIELLVYLAVRADGATSDEILEAMWPDTRRAPAAQRLHQAISNLRQNLAGSLPEDGSDRPDPVIKANGRWRLNPDVVDVDLWQLRAAHSAARGRSGQDRLAPLARACSIYTDALGGDADYEWLTRHRQGVLNLAVDAHTALAAALTDTDPEQALRLLQTAAELDPLNEDVARELMHAQHRAGDLDAVRATVRRLRLALDEIGAEPSAHTADLADELRRDLNRRAPESRPSV